MRAVLLLVATVALCLGVAPAAAFTALLDQLPNARHVTVGGAGMALGHLYVNASGAPVDAFGAAFQRARYNWSLLCRNDTDGDGYTDGQELGDPNCTWSPYGDADHGRPNADNMRSMPRPPTPAPPTPADDAPPTMQPPPTPRAPPPVPWATVSHPGSAASAPVPSITAVSLSFQTLLLNLSTHATFAANLGDYRAWSVANTSLCVPMPTWPEVACNFTTVTPALSLYMWAGGWPTTLSALDASNQGLWGMPMLNYTTMKPIRWLGLRGNSFTGPLNLTVLPYTLEYLDLSRNGFNGTVNMTGADVVYPPSLRLLDLSDNAFAAVHIDLARLPMNCTLRVMHTLPATEATVTDPMGRSVTRRPTPVVAYQCRRWHPVVNVTLTNGEVVHLERGYGVPAHCGRCVEADVYNLAAPGCDRIGTAYMAPNIANTTVRAVFHRNYCDEGCSASIAMLVLGILVLVGLSVAYLLCGNEALEEMASAQGKELDREPLAESPKKPAGQQSRNAPPPTAASSGDPASQPAPTAAAQPTAQQPAPAAAGNPPQPAADDDGGDPVHPPPGNPQQPVRYGAA